MFLISIHNCINILLGFSCSCLLWDEAEWEILTQEETNRFRQTAKEHAGSHISKNSPDVFLPLLSWSAHISLIEIQHGKEKKAWFYEVIFSSVESIIYL